MRSIGVAQYALDLMLQRVTDPAKKTFGKYLYEHGEFKDIAFSWRSRLLFPASVRDGGRGHCQVSRWDWVSKTACIQCCPSGTFSVVLYCASGDRVSVDCFQIDKFHAKGALKEIGIAKVGVFCLIFRRQVPSPDCSIPNLVCCTVDGFAGRRSGYASIWRRGSQSRHTPCWDVGWPENVTDSRRTCFRSLCDKNLLFILSAL